MIQIPDLIKKIKSLKREIYGEYGIYYYVPMAESFTVQIPVTVSCSYRKCLFCDLNQGIPFRELSLDEIESNIKKLRLIHELTNKPAKRFLLSGGNPFVLSTEKLLRISDFIHDNFPECEYISCFSRVDDVLRKSQNDLNILREAGYNRLCLGLESGSDEVLKFQNKGVTRSENISAMNTLDNFEIKYSAYIMLGLGGRNLSDLHVSKTVDMLNQANPFELTVVTLVLFKGAELVKKVRNHEFQRMSSLETLKEGRNILSELNISTVWNATHKTNLFPIKGKIPEHKNLLLNRIDNAIDEISNSDLKQYELKRWRKWGTE